MHDRPNTLYLADICDSGRAIQSYVQGMSFEAFSQDRLRNAAVIREFEIIGEAVGKLPDETKSRFPDVAWREIKDFRNLLIHEYFGVDLAIVWNVIQQELPGLLHAVESMLGSEGREK